MKKCILDNEPQIISRLKSGDNSAFEIIFYAFYHPLKLFAFQQLKSDTLAEDAVQEVFCTLWMNRSKLQTHLSLRGFLFTCLKNHILNTVRTKKRELLKHQRHFLQSQPKVNSTEFQVYSNEIKRNIRRGIEKLPEVKRQILLLNIYQGLDNQQIAEKLNLSIHTVKIYLSESSRQIRKLISSQEANLLLLLLISC